MHDLNTINKLNREAFEAAVDKYRAAGRWVLAKYTGLHLVSIETFSTIDEATTGHLEAVAKASPDENFRLLAPRGAVAQPTDATLADYINRKSA